MTKEKYLKRLNKCSKKSIAECLYSKVRNEEFLREIEIIEYNCKSKELLDKMDVFNKAASEIEIVDQKSKIRYLRLHEKWKELNNEHDKLQKWFDSLKLEVPE